MRSIQALPLSALLLASAAGAQVVINEVLYDPTGADGGLERIELRNLGPGPANLFGSSLAVCYPGTLLNNRTYWPFGPGFQIGPGQVVTVHYLQDGLDTNTDFYTGASGSQFICVTPPKNLDNAIGSVAIFSTTDCAQLFNPMNIVDFVQWGGVTYHQVHAVAAGIWPTGTWFADIAEGRTIAYSGAGDGPQAFFEDKSPTIGLPNESPGSPFVMPYGSGCAGSSGVPALDSIGGPPALGNQSFHLRLQNALAGAPALVGMSGSPAALPLFGCIAEIDITALILDLGPKTVDGTGKALFWLPVPDDLTLLGAPLHFQGVVVDAGSPAGVVALSSALQVVL